MTALVVAIVSAASLAASVPAGAAKKPAKITVLVTNDDGVTAPGIDAVVEALRTQKKTKVVVVAPAQDQSGTGGKSTEGGAVHAATATTASGYPATAVNGFPADSVDYALDKLKLKPNVVISGANSDQNLGPFVDGSGTVGAARRAAQRGIPALAVSQQRGDAPDFPTSARLAAEWLEKARKTLPKKPGKSPLTTIDSINAPNCPAGKIRGLLETTPAGPSLGSDAQRSVSECASTETTFANDVEAFNQGYATLSKLPATPATAG